MLDAVKDSRLGVSAFGSLLEDEEQDQSLPRFAY
jgi:hypothetical protein